MSHVDFCVDLLRRMRASKDAHFHKKIFSFFLPRKYEAVAFLPSNDGPEKVALIYVESKVEFPKIHRMNNQFLIFLEAPLRHLKVITCSIHEISVPTPSKKRRTDWSS